MQALILALDFGGAKHSAAIASRQALGQVEQAWLACGRVFAPPGADAQVDIALALEMARGLLADAAEGERPLGGGVTKAGDFWWETVRRLARETALADVQVDVVPAELGDDAPLWGAVALVA
jgi:hypothetical protein